MIVSKKITKTCNFAPLQYEGEFKTTRQKYYVYFRERNNIYELTINNESIDKAIEGIELRQEYYETGNGQLTEKQAEKIIEEGIKKIEKLEKNKKEKL